jgi:peptidoglycan/xylan/chitin deacetylase (PgdA/CDA1 family)
MIAVNGLSIQNNSVILGTHEVGLSSPAIRRLALGLKMSALILCYHKVGPESEEGRFLNVDPSTLARHVRFFQRRGFRFRRVSELDLSSREKQICLTFDDAYLSAVQNGVPQLERFGVPATFYAVPGESASAWDGPEKQRTLAALSDLVDLQTLGHEVGNHTLRHPHLAGLSRRMVLEELVGAQQLLEKFRLRVTSVCYPYGSYDAQTVRVCVRLGFRFGLSLRKGIASASNPVMELPRIVIGFRDTEPLLAYKIWLRPMLKRVGV